MFKNLSISALKSTLCTGGFIGWYLTVMYICEKSLEIYGTSSLFTVTNIIFDGALLATLLVMIILMMHLDFEGLLEHRYFRIVPAVLMAESGAALAFTNADSFSAYAVIIGICAAFGAMAVFSSLLNVRVSHRLFAVGVGTAIGGTIRLLDQLLYTHTDMTRGIYLLAFFSGVLALLTVRSSGFSKEVMPIISYSEASSKRLLRNIPSAYFLLFVLGWLYYCCLGRISAVGTELYAPTFHSYEAFTYLPYILTALVIGFFIKFHNVAPLYIFGICFLSYAAIMLHLPYFSKSEESAFLALFFMGQSCFAVFAYIYLTTFAMDCPHPLFHVMVGYFSIIAAQLCANLLNHYLPIDNPRILIVILAALIVIGGSILFALLKKHGLTQESFEHRRLLRELIAQTSEQMALSDREHYLLELIILDNYTAEQLPDKMMLSRNTVRVQTRNLLKKLELESMDELKPYFERLLTAQSAP